MAETPYMEVEDQPRVMKGKGAPRSTVFGVLGRTKMDPYTKVLGGLVHETTGSKKVHKGEIHKVSLLDKTERRIAGAPSKTHLPGAHFGQVPYAGQFMSHVGKGL